MSARHAAARRGLRLCQFPNYIVADELADDRLIEVLASCRPEPLPISLVCSLGRLLPVRVRVTIDALTKAARPAGT